MFGCVRDYWIYPGEKEVREDVSRFENEFSRLKFDELGVGRFGGRGLIHFYRIGKIVVLDRLIFFDKLLIIYDVEKIKKIR